MLPSLAMKLYECFLQWDPAAQLLCVLLSGVLHTFSDVLNPSIFFLSFFFLTNFQEHWKKGCAAAHTDRMQ